MAQAPALQPKDDMECRPPAGHAFWIFICNEESYAYSGAPVNSAYFCFNTSDPDETRVWLQFNAAHHATQGKNDPNGISEKIFLTKKKLRKKFFLCKIYDWTLESKIARNDKIFKVMN